MFSNLQNLAQHSQSCGEDKKPETVRDPLRMAIMKELDNMDPLADEMDPLADEAPAADISLDNTEKETNEMIAGLREFIKINDLDSSEDFDKNAEISEEVTKVIDTSNNSSIEIDDDEVEENVVNQKPVKTLKLKVPSDMKQASFKAPKPPPMTKKELRRAQILGKIPFLPKQCCYCGFNLIDRIALARHMISDHWEEVRNKQGGGRKDNRDYYNSIEDSRVIKPKPSATTSFHLKNLSAAGAANKIFPRLSSAVKSVNLGRSLAATNALNNKYANMNNTNPTWLGKLDKKPGETGSLMKINKLSRNVHNFAWYGSKPNRKIIKVQKYQTQQPTFAMSFDLTKDDSEEACAVCDDDFNWPDANHVCKRKMNKKGIKVTSSLPNQSSVLKKVERMVQPKSSGEMFKSLQKLASVEMNNRRKVLQSVVRNRSGSRDVGSTGMKPINVPIKDGKADFKNLVAQKFPSKSSGLQITPVMKKV